MRPGLFHRQPVTPVCQPGLCYEDYGFSYCFLQTWLNRGIRRPANYSQKAVADIVRSVEEKTAALSADPQTDVNVIFISWSPILIHP